MWRCRQPAKVLVWSLIRVRFSSEKEKSFREVFFSGSISLHFRISFAREKFENFRFFREISLQSVLRKNAKFSRNRKYENFEKNAKISRKLMPKFCEKKTLKFREKYRIFKKKQMQNFTEKVAKIPQERLNFENTRLIFKEGFIREPN